MNISAKERLLISNFIVKCDELADGKFIIADKKVRKILESITECETIYKLMFEYMSDFDKKIEFSKALVKSPSKPGYIVVPEDDTKLLPLVFCILVDIDTNKIDFKDFLKTYFSDGKSDPFVNFGQRLIKPFRDVIARLFETDGRIFEKEAPGDLETFEQETEANGIFEAVSRTSAEMLAVLKSIRKSSQVHDDIELVLTALCSSCSAKDLLTINALVLSIHYIGKKVKKLKFFIKELDQILLNFYDGKAF